MDLIMTVVDILKGSLFLSVPFFIVTLLLSFAHKKISKKFKLSWMFSTLIILVILGVVLTAFAFILPFSQAVAEENLGVRPPELEYTTTDYLSFAFFAAVRVLFVGSILGILAFPFALMGSFVFDWLKKKKFNHYLSMFAAVFSSTLVWAVLFLFFFGWVYRGLIYLLYFSG